MKTRKKIRDRYVHPGQKRNESGMEPPQTIVFPPPKRDADPKSLLFMIGFILSLESPESEYERKREPEQELFPGGEILICD